MTWKINNKTNQYRLVVKFSQQNDRNDFLQMAVTKATDLEQPSLIINFQPGSIGLAVPQQNSQSFRTAIADYLQNRENKTQSDSASSSGQDTDSLKLYCDGGSRGNPGPAASGYIIVDQLDQPVCQGGSFLGVATNNQAEYESLKKGLTRAVSMGIKSLHAYMDSQLVVRQVQGQYRVKNPDLQLLHKAIVELVAEFVNFRISFIPRELNKTADAIVNQTLDNHSPETKRRPAAASARSKG